MSEFTIHHMHAVQAQVVRAIDDKDPALFASLYALDGALLPADGRVVRGRAAIADFFGGWLDDGFRTQTLEDIVLTSGDGVAVEEGVAIAGYADGSTARSNYIVVHVRQPDGTWLMHRDIWTSVPRPVEQ